MVQTEKIFSGSDAKVYFDGEELFHLKKFEAKVTPKFESLEYIGSYDEYSRLVGYSGKGVFTVSRTDSFVYRRFIQQMQQRTTPKFTIIGESSNPETGDIQTAIIRNCQPEGDFSIMVIEPTKGIEDQIGFTFLPSLVEWED